LRPQATSSSAWKTAVAAAVSMMAGTYLDVETRRDQAKAASALTARLRGAGLGPDKAASIATWLSSDPASLKSLAVALNAPEAPDDSEGPLAQSLLMLVADFLAAAIPIAPFALLPVAEGRVVSGTVTVILLIGLGMGRAWIGGRPVARTLVETVSIGVAAALAGVAIGTAMARAFGG
jgi:VIT1/CCC1 family predicted Fe2+/Mn2+ transporter